MKLYALLIGINDYPEKPLRQCVADVEKMESYLNGLRSDFDEVEILSLTDSDATRDQVISSISTHLGKAGDSDVAFLYYSGHGAQEETAGLFAEEHDGLLESMVCFNGKKELESGQLLADKELRYLLYKLPNNPHLVTIFDACHSGDIVRSLQPEAQDDDMIKRISGSFEPRAFENFVFAKDDSVIREIEGEKKVYIPFKNHVHIAACLSSESSWEDSKGGVFTRYLLQLLENLEHSLSYLDITRWAKISMKKVTRKKQTPTISVQGTGNVSAQSSWLNLHPAGVQAPEGKMINSDKNGWIFTRGSLLGVQADTKVIVALGDDEEVTLSLKSVDIDHSVLDIPMELVNRLDFDKPYYPARTELSTHEGLKVSINMIDDEEETANTIKDILSAYPKVELSERDEADFGLNIFNGFAYFSLPEQEFQPLAKQIALEDDQILETSLKEQLRALVKWNHFYSLENPGKDYEESPIEVSLKEEDGDWVDVTNSTHRLRPRTVRLAGGEQYQKVTMQVKNVSKQRIYVGVLTLSSDIGITSKPFDGKVIELNPGESKTLYDHTDQQLVFSSIDHYKEVYNWKEEWFYYKFIFNNYEDFSPLLNDKDYLQPPLTNPLTIEPETKSLKRAQPRGEGGEMEEVIKKWGTCRTRIELANETYNMVSSDLKDLWEEYADSEELGPFIKELYFEEFFNGKTFELRLKQNKDQSSEEAVRATDSWIVRQLNRIYNRSRRRKFRRQKHRSGPLVVAEGDSWFLFPKPGVRDTIDYIMKEYRLLSLADAGDEIADYIKNNELLEAVSKQKPDFVLISGGGNDILGSEIKEILNKGATKENGPLDFVDQEKFKNKMDFLRDGYTMFFEEIHQRKPEATIFIHGYDYIRSNPDPKTIKNGWANKYMIEAGITNPSDREEIIAHLVDTFNGMLAGFTTDYPHVRYVKNLNTVRDNEWMDEIHPNNTGYKKVAKNFLREMQTQQ